MAGTAIWEARFQLRSMSSIAATVDVSPTMRPTDRSMPAVRMTKVMPREMRPLSAVLRRTSRWLATVRKPGARAHPKMKMAISPR